MPSPSSSSAAATPWCSPTSTARARDTASEIGAAEGLAQDVRDEASHTAVAKAAAAHGVLTVWVNNAGVGYDGTLAELGSTRCERSSR